jgi:nucleobase:cation symporter-1, NCS1 family
VQSYWGGLAMSVILSAMSPGFQSMENTLSPDAMITTKQLIGFIIYIIIFTSLMFIHPSKLQPLIYLSQYGVMATILGLFIWALAANGGASILPPSKEISSRYVCKAFCPLPTFVTNPAASERSFRILQAMSSVAGSWTGAAIRQSDWTRYSKTRYAAVGHQLISGPIILVICTTMGITATSAVANMYGTPIWNPIVLLETLQVRDYNATTRAGTFFAGVGFFLSQITINLIQNSVSCGMDLASMAPKYIDVTRGSLIMCLVGYLIQPWRFVNQAGMFINVLSSFGMFVSPLAGINVVDL